MKYTTRPLGTWDGARTPARDRRSRSTFKAPWPDTMDLLAKELGYLDAKNVVLEADVREQDLRLDGMPRSNAKAPVDPGVRIFFESKHGALAYQSDSCDYWQHNVRSVALGLGALRAVDRYGITKKAEQYAGWRQIESAKPDYWSAMQTLAELAGIDGVGSGSGDVAKAYRIAARRHHPDTGGTVEMWHLLQDIAVTLGVNS